MTYGSSLLLVDAIKALASQLIIWHHFAVYSPMSDVIHPHATAIVDWLYGNARVAVQAFLVIGGFLAARSLAPSPDAVATTFARSGLAHRLWSRYLRLSLPYVVALAFAIACAALARGLAADPDIPAAPSATQVLAHIFLLQDIVNVDALSAGVWYVAIDFQLYALFALLLWSAQRLARITGLPVGRVAVTLCGSLAAASLFWLNRDRTLDQWAPYFFGAYGLGVFAQWVSNSPRRNLWLAVMAATTATALVIDWRTRILVASLTALILASGAGARLALKGVAGRAVAALGRISYPVFLVHYPVSLVVGALVIRLGRDGLAASIVGLMAAWALSLAAGVALQRWAEIEIALPAGLFGTRWARAR